MSSAFFWALDYDDGADHPAGCGNVEEHGLFLSRRRQDRQRGQHLLQLMKSLIGLVIPLEVVGLLHDAVEGKSFLSEPAYEAVKGSQVAGNFWMSRSRMGFSILSMALIFTGLHSIPRSETRKPMSWPAGTQRRISLG